MKQLGKPAKKRADAKGVGAKLCARWGQNPDLASDATLFCRAHTLLMEAESGGTLAAALSLALAVADLVICLGKSGQGDNINKPANVLKYD